MHASCPLLGPVIPLLGPVIHVRQSAQPPRPPNHRRPRCGGSSCAALRVRLYLGGSVGGATNFSTRKRSS
eukprot:156015-Rhodomonas_salina.1